MIWLHVTCLGHSDLKLYGMSNQEENLTNPPEENSKSAPLYVTSKYNYRIKLKFSRKAGDHDFNTRYQCSCCKFKALVYVTLTSICWVIVHQYCAFESMTVSYDIMLAPSEHRGILNIDSMLRLISKETSKLCIGGPFLWESSSDRCIPPPKGPISHRVFQCILPLCNAISRETSCI